MLLFLRQRMLTAVQIESTVPINAGRITDTPKTFNGLARAVRFHKVGDDRQRGRGDHAVRRDDLFRGNDPRPASTRSLLTGVLVVVALP